MENKLKNICDFYAMTHKLKDLIRTGSIVWKVKAERLDSVAEHIYGTQILAFAINSEFELGFDMEKIVFMLAFHELGETIVGDIPPVDVMENKITKEQKHIMEMEAVLKILKPLKAGNKVLEIYKEYEENITAESRFAHMVDKLECDFQIKFFEEKGCNNDWSQPLEGLFEKLRQEYTAKGCKTMAKAWIEYDKRHYDDLFKSIADYLADNDIF